MRTIAAATAAALATACPGQEFVRLPEGFEVRCVSGDGRVVGGAYRSANLTLPAVWTAEGGVEALRGPGGAEVDGVVFALSVTGDTAAGTTHALGVQCGFRWTAEGLIPLPPPAGCPTVTAYGVSDDGGVVVGEGYVWTAAGGLRYFAGRGTCREGPNGVSGDGRVCAGPLLGGVWRWDVEDLEGERISSGSDSGSTLCHVNRTGDVVVGSYGYNAPTGFVWTPGGFRLVPEVRWFRDVSGDGRVVVGQLRGRGACYATEGLGAASLAEHAALLGIDLGGAALLDAVGVSDDGRTIVGEGGVRDWVMRLPAARPGDFNGDEETTVDDLILFLDCFVGEAVLPPSAADVNRDDFTDWADFDEFLAGFGG